MTSHSYRYSECPVLSRHMLHLAGISLVRFCSRGRLIPPPMNLRACVAKSMPSSHTLRQIASALDNCSLTTVDEKLSEVTTPLYPIIASAWKDSAKSMVPEPR